MRDAVVRAPANSLRWKEEYPPAPNRQPMCARILRCSKKAKRKETEAPISPLRERARDAAEALHSDNSCRWFPLNDVFPVHNYLYDYFHGRPEDTRLRRIAQDAMARLREVATRLERSAASPLPPEWEQAKAALAEASSVLDSITQSW